MTYRPTFRKQGDGSRCAWQNCSPTSHSMAVDRDHRGVKPATAAPWLPTPVAIRNKINLFCPGTDFNQNAAAVKALYATTMAVRYYIPFVSFRDLIVSGRGAVVSILYRRVLGTAFAGSAGFVGGHAIYVNERRWNATKGIYEALVGDPLADGRALGNGKHAPTGFQWWPWSLVLAASADRYGAGVVGATFTRDTEV